MTPIGPLLASGSFVSIGSSGQRSKALKCVAQSLTEMLLSLRVVEAGGNPAAATSRPRVAAGTKSRYDPCTIFSFARLHARHMFKHNSSAQMSFSRISRSLPVAPALITCRSMLRHHRFLPAGSTVTASNRRSPGWVIVRHPPRPSSGCLPMPFTPSHRHEYRKPPFWAIPLSPPLSSQKRNNSRIPTRYTPPLNPPSPPTRWKRQMRAIALTEPP